MPREKLSKGDLQVFDGEDNRRLPVGPDGTVLTAKASEDLAMEFAASAAGDVHPVVDTTELVKDPTIDTKRMRIDVGLVAAAFTRILSMPDKDVNIDPAVAQYNASRLQGLVVQTGTPSIDSWLAYIDSTGQYQILDLPVAIGRGGTGAANPTAGFNALAPADTKGDIIVHNGADNVRLPVGNQGELLRVKSSEAAGLKWSKLVRVVPIFIKAPTTDDQMVVYWGNEACKVIAVYDICKSATSMGFDLTKRARSAPFSGGTKIKTAGFSATTTGNETTSFDSASLALDDILFLKVSSVSGTPAEVMVLVEIEMDTP